MNNDTEMLKSLQRLISIPSISGQKDDEFPFGKAPYKALKHCLDLCSELGFRTKFCDKYMGYAEIGNGEKLVGILAHVDVVPAGDGWTVEPFDMTIIDDNLYGRGIVDDKGPVMAVIYAMKDIIDSGIKLNKRVRLILGCSEETGNWIDMEYYKTHEELPDYGFTVDSNFPVVHSEKGILHLKLKMQKGISGIIGGRGGSAPNMVPSYCELSYIDDYNNTYTVEGFGKSAHASVPEEGVNAIELAMKKAKGSFANFYNQIIGIPFNKSLLGCTFSNEQLNNTSVNVGILDVDDKFVNLILDIRYPHGIKAFEITKAIKNSVSKYNVTIQMVNNEKPMYVDENKAFVQTLINVYRDITSDMTPPKIVGGGTYAKAMNNIVAFGPDFPNKVCTEHQPNEHFSIKDLFLIRQIYRAAIEKI